MGKLGMVRVDYRMVYGQIMTKWIKSRPVDHSILADGNLVDDPLIGDIYRMAIPDCGVGIVRLGDVQTAIGRKNDTVLLIFKDVASVYMVYKNGPQLPEPNVDAVQNSAQRKIVAQGAVLTAKEYEELSEMKAESANILLQSIPGNDPVSLGSIEKKLK